MDARRQGMADHTAFPTAGVHPDFVGSGPIVNGTLRQEDPRYSSGPRELPMATGRGQIKNPALVSEGGV